MSKQYWTKTHALYSQKDWIRKPTIFAEYAIQHFPKEGKILDLGAGQGQDSRYFAKKGYDVVSTDYEKLALGVNESNITPELKEKITVKEVDLSEKLPFYNQEFDVIYSHLSIHYFNLATTKKIFEEMRRVLKINGIFAFLVNSKKDPEISDGKMIEKDYYDYGTISRRYFDTESVKELIQGFEIIILDDQGETFKDSAIGVFNLIRFIGKRVE
ncbi:class I SAM-dependent methyltransferase [Patescibacteria group bacterium]|nr:class I SAM-dependent methyltransferase [Patescibacteria group bacterium]MBU2235730.1 class I SAM-dependent methyltransferase [Patescibacteria group bacterium]